MYVLLDLQLEERKVKVLYITVNSNYWCQTSLKEYYKKRNFVNTPEPQGSTEQKSNKESDLRFVVQKHDATRLHYDFRLETKKPGGDVLKSWAVPKGLSLDPKIKRLAVLTEDHPLDYLLFEGIIPEGNYGAGTVIVWDTGTYTTESDISEQFNQGKIGFTLHGQKLRGRFYLVKTSTENQWLLLKKTDEFDSEEDLTASKPNSVLTGRSNDQLATKKRQISKSNPDSGIKGREERNKHHIENNNQEISIPQDFPTNVKPMLATLVDKPFDSKEWVFEVKWDGIRSIFYMQKTKDILKLESRNGINITHRYPEIVDSLKSVTKCKESAILDGEIVVLNKEGYPDFGSHKERMSVNSNREISRLSKSLPATYYLFDILHLDGNNLQNRSYLDRRRILNEIISQSNDKNSKRVRVSDFIDQEGIGTFENVKKMNLEGIIAKNKFSKYFQGTRSTDWLKIKNTKTQDCVVIGYTPGEGNREKYFGSLILAVFEQGQLRFAGHTGSGFNTNQLKRAYNTIQNMRIEKSPIDHIPYTNGKPIWIKPQLVAEIKFDNWTNEKILRAPIFQRFREDKSPEDCTIQAESRLEEVVVQAGGRSAVMTTAMTMTKPHSLLDSFSNLDKVFWNKTAEHSQLTKGDLIEYYDKASSYILPHLKDRPLSLSRYPDGINGKSFYHKNWNQSKPDYVKTVKVYSQTRGDLINYILCNNKETLLWIANLGCIEMHPWYSRVIDSDSCKDSELDQDKCGLSYPDYIIFDLDPYIYSGNENKGEEPEYNIKGFKSAVEIAYLLKELFDELKIISYVKTSGKTGLHIFVPLIRSYSYDQTRGFAEIVGRILIKRYPQKITTIWDISQRSGKVFFDYNQNAKGKTIASVFSARPSVSATVSMPVKWKELDNILPSDLTILTVPNILKRHEDPWKDILERGQDLGKILDNLSPINL
jgi:bifunctional non-homologous end joining protein LigD